MKCDQVSELLSSFYDGELNGDRAVEIELHVEGCKRCAAELHSFAQLSAMLSAAPRSVVPAGQWEQIAARLDAEHASLPQMQTNLRTERAPSRPYPRRTAWGLAAALAASLLLVSVLRRDPQPGQLSLQRDSQTAGQGPNDTSNVDSLAAKQKSASIAIDYSTVIKAQAEEPARALHAISRQFQGREVPNDEAEHMLGYRPAILNALPTQTRVVSTHLLKLPNCSCAGGQCRCGPHGCNCAVSLCQREDGSRFLVFEHCKTQGVSFGEKEEADADGSNEPVRFIDTGHSLAVSWAPGARRVTAIGLKNRTEATDLVAAVDRTASFH